MGKFLKAFGIGNNDRDARQHHHHPLNTKSSTGGFAVNATPGNGAVPASLMMSCSGSSVTDRGSPASLATQLTRVALDDVYDKELALSNQPSISSMSHVSRQRPAPIPVAGSPRPSQNRSINDSFEWHYNELVEDDPAPFSNLNEMDKRLHVLVIGAGLGGLSAAIACARQGFAVTLLEKGSGVSPHGDLISLGCNSNKILGRWGILPALWNHACHGGWWLLLNEDGILLREEDLRDFPALYGAPLLQGHRAQFLGVFGSEARCLKVRVRLNTEVIAYTDSKKQPSVTTASGEVIFADCIVVADGVHSLGRDLLEKELAAADRNPVPASAKATPPSEYSVHRSLVRADKVAANPETAYLLDGCVRTWLGHDSHLTVAPLDNNRQLSFSFVHYDFSNTASNNWRDRRPITEVTQLLKGWDPALVQAIETFKTTLNWRKSEELQSGQWFTAGGKIVLIGDSVHPLPPSSFQGGSQSIEDGASLAICLALSGGTSADVPRALEAFQAIRQPRVLQCLENGHRQRDLWHSYMSSLCASNLDLLIATAYDHDAELHAMNTFERTVQTLSDPNFSLDRKRKANVLSKLHVGREPTKKSSLYARLSKPSKPGTQVSRIEGETGRWLL